MQEPSAYSNRSDDTAYFISLTCIRKSKGLGIDPWDTPHEVFEMLEYLFSMLHLHFTPGFIDNFQFYPLNLT